MGKNKIKFKNNRVNSKPQYKWIIGIVIVTFLLTIVFSFVSSILLEKFNIIQALIILIIIVFIGIVFDMLGIAVATADETPFHSMASNRIKGAKESILLIRNASMVSNFFNDVIGDICGIISGTAASVIILKIFELGYENYILEMSITAFVASYTVGGKSIGKGIAMKNANYIVYYLGLIMSYLGYNNKNTGKTNSKK